MIREFASGLAIKYIQEPLLEFGYGQKLEYSRDGLYLYGPKQGASVVSDIRYGVIGTSEGVIRFHKWAKSVNNLVDVPLSSVNSQTTGSHHIPFPGFEQSFGVKWNHKPVETISDVILDDLLETLKISNRYEAIKNAVTMYVERLISAHDRLENPPSFWFVVIPEEVYQLGRPQSRLKPDERVQGEVRVTADRARKLADWPSLFEEENKEAELYKYDVHFRRQLKARLLKDRIVTQVVRETTLTPEEFVNESGYPLRRLEDPASIAWNLCSCAFYKAGGRPWQLAEVRPGVCYVGLVYKKVKADEDDRFACCAAQMFLTDGDGVVFRGALGPWYSPDSREFHLDKSNAHNLINMVIQEFEYIHGQSPSELFIHGRSAFNRAEWTGFEMGCPSETNLVGVQILDARENLKLFRLAKYPVLRGTVGQLTSKNAFLWTTGYVPRLDTYMGPETPNPIQVKILNGRCKLATVLHDVLGLTKINFNSCVFSDRLPVTIKFADAVGEVLMSAPLESEPKLPFKFYI